jgi:HlyD family secretion protein
VIIGSEVGGYRVAAVLVDVGTKVSKGQALVRLSGDLLQADLDSKRAALRSAEASQINAAAALRRGDSISATGALSAADLDKLRAEGIAAEARVETAGADLRTSELRARYATVTAPDSGTITSRTVSVGQIAQAGAEMLRMLRQNRVEWRAEVPEAELKNISIGQEVTISAVDGSKLTGKVRAISPTVQATNRTGIVYIDITNGQARPGMFARGEIEVGSGMAVLLPVASVVSQDGYSYVFVLNDKDVVQRQRIEPAGIHGEDVEVRSGVNVGDVVAVKGAGFLKDGDTISIAEQDVAGSTTGKAGGNSMDGQTS